MRMRGRTAGWAVALGTAGGVLVLSGMAVAETADPVYTGCLNNGMLTSVAVGDEPLKTCSSAAQQISWNQTGPQGPQGEPGPQGPAGPQGQAGEDGGGPDEVAVWDATYTGSGETEANIDSTDVLEKGTVVRALDGKLTGDFSSCTGWSEVMVEVPGSSTLAYWSPTEAVTDQPAYSLGDLVVTREADRGLNVTAWCYGQDGRVEVPNFELSVTFEWTEPTPLTPTTTFD